ncbi:MAG: carbohydrate kinase family protein, partial [Candidatus Omnitrophota bacterium]
MTILDTVHTQVDLWGEHRQAKTENEIYQNLDVITVSLDREAEAITQSKDPKTILEYFINRGVKIAILKNGPHGSYALQKAGSLRFTHFPAVEGLNIKDTIGAGDAFSAGLIYGIVKGFSLIDSIRLASICGGLACEQFGCGRLGDDGLERVLERFNNQTALTQRARRSSGVQTTPEEFVSLSASNSLTTYQVAQRMRQLNARKELKWLASTTEVALDMIRAATDSMVWAEPEREVPSSQQDQPRSSKSVLIGRSLVNVPMRVVKAVGKIFAGPVELGRWLKDNIGLKFFAIVVSIIVVVFTSIQIWIPNTSLRDMFSLYYDANTWLGAVTTLVSLKGLFSWIFFLTFGEYIGQLMNARLQGIQSWKPLWPLKLIILPVVLVVFFAWFWSMTYAIWTLSPILPLSLIGVADQITTSPISILAMSLCVHWAAENLLVKNSPKNISGFFKRKSIGILYAIRTNFIVLSLWFGFVFSFFSNEALRMSFIGMLSPITSVVMAFFLNNNKAQSLKFKTWAIPLMIATIIYNIGFFIYHISPWTLAIGALLQVILIFKGINREKVSSLKNIKDPTATYSGEELKPEAKGFLAQLISDFHPQIVEGPVIEKAAIEHTIKLLKPAEEDWEKEAVKGLRILAKRGLIRAGPKELFLHFKRTAEEYSLKEVAAFSAFIGGYHAIIYDPFLDISSPEDLDKLASILVHEQGAISGNLHAENYRRQEIIALRAAARRAQELPFKAVVKQRPVKKAVKPASENQDKKKKKWSCGYLLGEYFIRRSQRCLYIPEKLRCEIPSGRLYACCLHDGLLGLVPEETKAVFLKRPGRAELFEKGHVEVKMYPSGKILLSKELEKQFPTQIKALLESQDLVMWGVIHHIVLLTPQLAKVEREMLASHKQSLRDLFSNKFVSIILLPLWLLNVGWSSSPSFETTTAGFTNKLATMGQGKTAAMMLSITAAVWVGLSLVWLIRLSRFSSFLAIIKNHQTKTNGDNSSNNKINQNELVHNTILSFSLLRYVAHKKQSIKVTLPTKSTITLIVDAVKNGLITRVVRHMVSTLYSGLDSSIRCDLSKSGNQYI